MTTNTTRFFCLSAWSMIGCFVWAFSSSVSQASEFDIRYFRAVSSASIELRSSQSEFVLRHGTIPGIAIEQTASSNGEWVLRPLIGAVGKESGIDDDRLFFDRFERLSYLFPNEHELQMILNQGYSFAKLR